jgi:hypothetical protein
MCASLCYVLALLLLRLHHITVRSLLLHDTTTTAVLWCLISCVAILCDNSVVYDSVPPTPNISPACLDNLGGGLFETGAGGSAPKHVEQFLKEVSVVQGVGYVLR